MKTPKAQIVFRLRELIDRPAGPMCGLKYSLFSACLLLSACSQAPIVHIQYVSVPQFLPIPATLTAPVKVDLYPNITYGEALGALYIGLETCNSDKAAIATLKPSTPPEPNKP